MAMKALIVAVMLVGCGGSSEMGPDGSTGNARSCGDFEGHVTFVQPTQWCRLSLTGEDGSNGVYFPSPTLGDHYVIAIGETQPGGSVLSANEYKSVDGNWYAHAEQWPQSASLGLALQVGEQSANTCAWFTCDALVPFADAPSQAPHPW